MALPPDLDLNGFLYSHASCDVRIFGMRMKGAKEFAWKATVESGAGRGTAREDLGHTVGTVAYEASATVLGAYWDAIKDDCRGSGFAPLDRPGMVSITIAEPGKPSKKVEIRFSRISESDRSSADGPDAHEVKLTFKALVILEDGKPLVSRSLYSKGAI
jgi:hypothetical protein